MQLSSIPAKIAAIFAASGTKNTIPLTTAGIANPNNASFDVGFPAITMQPVASGGLPPFGADFNGLANAITAVQQWQNAGGIFPYDSAFSSSIGGYAKGSLVLFATGLGIWQSTVDNNTSDPDTGGANWNSLPNFAQLMPQIATNTHANGGTGTAIATVTFTAASKGILIAWGGRNLGQQDTFSYTTTLTINGSTVDGDTCESSVSLFGTATISSGQSVTATCSSTSNVPCTSRVMLVFIPTA